MTTPNQTEMMERLRKALRTALDTSCDEATIWVPLRKTAPPIKLSNGVRIYPEERVEYSRVEDGRTIIRLADLLSAWHTHDNYGDDRVIEGLTQCLVEIALNGAVITHPCGHTTEECDYCTAHEVCVDPKETCEACIRDDADGEPLDFNLWREENGR